MAHYKNYNHVERGMRLTEITSPPAITPGDQSSDRTRFRENGRQIGINFI